MTAEQFVYWLQGYVEIADPQGKVWDEIRNHLKLVLTKKTPVDGTNDYLKNLRKAVERYPPVMDRGRPFWPSSPPHPLAPTLALTC